MKMKKSFQLLSFLLFSSHLSLFLGKVAASQSTTIPFDVGVILDYTTDNNGKKFNTSIAMALDDFYARNSFYKTRMVLHVRDGEQDIVDATFMAIDLIENVQVQAIIGPQYSGEAKFIADLGKKSQVPIVSFSATSPSLSSALTPFFIRTAYKDSAQVKTIAAVVQAFGWREAVPVYVDSEYGNGIVPYLIDAFQAINTRVPYRSVISPNASDDQILEELHKLMTMQTRVFIVHMLPSLGSHLFLKAKEVGMMNEGYAWIITDGMTNFLSSMDPSVMNSMEGVLGVRPHVPRSKKLHSFEVSWKKKFLQENPDTVSADLDIYVLWAYDTAWALAMAAEKVVGVNSSSKQHKYSLNISNVESLRVSQIGLELRQEILNTQFEGLSGEFKLVDGQLQSSIFRIVNVIGSGEKDIGFWTPMNGIFQNLNVTMTKTYSTSKDNLRTIIWPGDSTTIPKGWEIPTNEKKLMIGVPVKDGFTDFVNLQWDNTTNASTVTGYCIDVFKAVMDTLPFAVPYEYIPFAKADHKRAGTYDDLVYQVYLQKYDAVVGDTTITANRTLYVDFTLPYTESVVSLIVPIKEDHRKNAWIFLKPLSTDLWLTTAAFFVFTGFVIWVLEHRINEEFRGPRDHQVGTILWFSFSTILSVERRPFHSAPSDHYGRLSSLLDGWVLQSSSLLPLHSRANLRPARGNLCTPPLMVFSHKEKVVSNLARFILIIWLFFVLIITSSYTASLTSMLTVQQLQPTVTDVEELLKNGENVGYHKGSFVFGLLKQTGFDDSKLKIYDSEEDLDKGLSKGTANGGFAAAFDETPYLKLFLSKYCSKYTIVGRTYKTDGFGFVFPRGSPLLNDVSRAVLSVTGGDEMRRIEKKWFGDTNCPDSSTIVSSGSLSVQSFWGLFLITGFASFSALFAFVIHFFWMHKHIWRDIDTKATLWQRIVIMANLFDRKDFTCFTFKNHELQNQNTPDSMGFASVPVSPSIISQRTNADFVSSDDQATTSTETTQPSPSNPKSEEISLNIELSNQEIIKPRCLEAIPQRPESSEREQDALIWGLNSGTFAVKPEYGLPSQKVWEVLSTAMLPPRVKTFLWRACANGLSVKENLLRLNMVDDDLCPHCGQEAESVAHALFYCQVSKRLWFGSPLSIRIPDTPQVPIHEWVLQCSNAPNFGHRDGQIAFASQVLICWEIWKYRNGPPLSLDQWFQVLDRKIFEMNQALFPNSDSSQALEGIQSPRDTALSSCLRPGYRVSFREPER